MSASFYSSEDKDVSGWTAPGATGLVALDTGSDQIIELKSAADTNPSNRLLLVA
jgi:hypothetical protein